MIIKRILFLVSAIISISIIISGALACQPYMEIYNYSTSSSYNIITCDASNIHLIRFLIVDRFGNKQTGVNVSAVMTSSPTDDTNWLSTLFGISNQATPINSTVMYDQTDDYGSAVFPMIASAKYTLTFTKASAGISESLYFPVGHISDIRVIL